MISRKDVIRIYNLLDKENGRPVLSKHNLEVVNKEYFAAFEKSLAAMHNCNKEASRSDVIAAIRELNRCLPVRFVREVSIENLANYITQTDDFWNAIEQTNDVTGASAFVNDLARVSAENDGRREFSLCSALCRYCAEFFQGKYTFPFYNGPVRSVLGQYINYRHNQNGDVYRDFADAVDRLSRQVGLNYVELDHILWIYGKKLSIHNSDN